MFLVDRDSGGTFATPFAGTASGYPGVPVVAGRRAHPPLYATPPRKFRAAFFFDNRFKKFFTEGVHSGNIFNELSGDLYFFSLSSSQFSNCFMDS